MLRNLTSITLDKETIEKIKLMNDKSFIHYIRNNADFIKQIMHSIPINLYKRGHTHPRDIFSIIILENIDEEYGIDLTILQDYLINKK